MAKPIFARLEKFEKYFSCYRPAHILTGFSLFALIITGCASQIPPDQIPDVQPVDTVATEVAAGSISTVPKGDVPAPVSGHAPILPSASGAKVQDSPVQSSQAALPATPSVPASTAATSPVLQSPEEQRIAAMELNLLNMSNELAWLKSQPASSTTPWGTLSPTITEGPVSGQARSLPPAAAGSPDKNAANKQQAERIARLEENIKALSRELERAKNKREERPSSPWGTVPDAEQIGRQAAAAPKPESTPLAGRKATVTVGELPLPPQAPAPQVSSAAAVSGQGAPPPINPDAMTKYPITVPFAEVANKTIPAPDMAAVATPPLQGKGASSPAATSQGTVSYSRPAYSATSAQAVRPAAGVGTAPVITSPQINTQASQRPAGKPAQTPGPKRGEQSAYNAAYNAYSAKRYNEAWNAFDRYLQEYPGGRYTPNAIYWKGEVRYDLGDYAGAILLFKDVIARYPGHAKAPDALLKVVMSYDKLKDMDNAALHLRILNEDYPKSEAARRAKRMNLS